MTQQPAMGIAANESIEDLLATLAATDVVRFRRFFRSILETAPEQVIRTAIRHLADHEVGEAERYMIVLLSTRDDYPPAIFDSQNLTLDQAGRVAAVMFQNDPKFSVKLSAALDVTDAADSRSLVRALDLLSVIPDPSVFVKCLRNLAGHADGRVRSKAVMLLCRLRPNRVLVERQLQSSDPRVRANVIEAMWHLATPETRTLFRESLSDSHHRVVANALLGLHYFGDESTLEKGAQLAEHPSPLFRAAIAWALGQMNGSNVIPILESLAKDPAPNVRRNAVRSLAILTAQEGDQSDERPV